MHLNNPAIDSELVFGIVCSTIAIVLLASGILLVLFIGNRQRLQQKMQQEIDYEKELRRAETEISEQLMERFAQELHDNIGHSLTCIRMHIENKKLDVPELQELFEPIDIYLGEASDQLRSLSRSFNTDYISSLGFIGAVSLEVKRLQQLKRFSITFEYEDEPINLDVNQELMGFRIFQEILHNVNRHSGAKHLLIRLNNDNGFTLIVQDDGIGFDVHQTLQSSNASGLRNILKRSALAKLNCTITSENGLGCKYILCLDPSL